MFEFHSCPVLTFVTEIFVKMLYFVTYNVKSDISLIRASESMANYMEDDYLMSQCTTGCVNVTVVEEDHMTILDNDALAKVFNEKILKHD